MTQRKVAKVTKNSLLIVLEGNVCAVNRYANSPCPFPVMWNTHCRQDLRGDYYFQ